MKIEKETRKVGEQGKGEDGDRGSTGEEIDQIILLYCMHVRMCNSEFHY